MAISSFPVFNLHKSGPNIIIYLQEIKKGLSSTQVWQNCGGNYSCGNSRGS